MSRTIRKGKDWSFGKKPSRFAAWCLAWYPMNTLTHGGRKFKSAEEYDAHRKRKEYDKGWFSYVGMPSSSSPKGYDLYNEYGGSAKKWYKRGAARIMRIRAKLEIDAELQHLNMG